MKYPGDKHDFDQKHCGNRLKKENKHPGNTLETDQKRPGIEDTIKRLTRKHPLNRPETLAIKTKKSESVREQSLS